MVKQRKTCEERELGALRCQPEIRQWRPGCYSHSYWLQAKLWEGERETREWREGGGGADSGERECVDSKSNSYPFHLFIAQYQEVLLVSHGHPAPSVVKPRSKYHCMEGRQKEWVDDTWNESRGPYTMFTLWAQWLARCWAHLRLL